ncbi:hypothetical protein, partial [Burkholderia mallei]|uniref:hypothetical protein n=1 Tax=Burkholderia mallei TaxID=13373 RepID=UPI001C5422B8
MGFVSSLALHSERVSCSKRATLARPLPESREGRNDAKRREAKRPYARPRFGTRFRAAYCMNQPWLTTNDWPVSAAL